MALLIRKGETFVKGFPSCLLLKTKCLGDGISSGLMTSQVKPNEVS